ncbi:MAG: hypothetical protein KatS3mg129_1165 [Leptospiraceae bacterium]|nr:MAG: hypothetical protein KatS3mg129_1165 [Leptospiraceae bacterium]
MTKKRIIIFLKELLFIFSLLPLILNWIVGIFINDTEKKPYIYRNFLISIVFLIISSLLYLLYYFITELYFSILFNYIFFVIQLIFVFIYVYFSLIHIIAYIKNKHYKIFNILDQIQKDILNYI